MSTTDPKPFRKQKQKESKSHPAQNGAERLKTVVRRLPPNLPEEIFWQSVQAWVTDETVTWKSYHPGKLRTKRLNRESVPSRAYIAFKSEAQLVTFSRAYDGHVFRDKTGNESHAIVEYAPFQRVPTEKKKADARNNTIDKDEDYLSFLETLKGGAKTESVSLDALIAASQPPPPPTTTPLLEALKAEKSALKDRETILRNHAHYKDPGVSGVPSSKKEEGLKKKAVVAAAAAAAKSETAAVTGKKGKKAVAHKGTLQDGQGQSGSGKGPAGGVAALPSGANSGAKPPAAAASSGGRGARQRPPKEPHGRAQVAKGETSTAPAPAPVAASGSGSGPTAPPTGVSAAIEPTPVSPPAQGLGQRKNRPVVGLGRHFEAALTGAGVALSPGSTAGPGERKRRDKGGESGPGGGAGPGPGSTESGGGAGKSGKQKYREERAQPPEVVPSILQRPVETVSADVQRSQSPRGAESSAGHGEVGGPGGRGHARRGRVRRGGHRGQ